MPEIFNPLLSAGEFLVSETTKRDGVTGLERLFVGTLDEVKQRWAASAVLDNAGAHRANANKDFLAENFEVTFMPAYSCRFNSIENVWGLVKQIFRRRME